MSNRTGSALPAPSPMAGKNQPVEWLFVYKFNGASFPGCDNGVYPTPGTPGIFGGTVQTYPAGHSQQYVFATSKNPALVKGTGCVGATPNDPLGATFGQVYNTPGYFYVLWNDQFYGNPIATQSSPWGHSKGMVAWNDAGEGFVMQVSTPSWPGSASSVNPRMNDGNTLGCVSSDDDIEVAQHFFALKINKSDLSSILKALINSSVVTDITQPEIVQNGGPSDIQALVNQLGKQSSSTAATMVTLSSGVQLISKPSALNVPVWQMVSAKLNSLPMRVASWWASPQIYSTDGKSMPSCWSASLGKPGPVEIATTGNWAGTTIGLEGGDGDGYNHAKIGISKDSSKPVCVFGDMNQQGGLCPGYAYANQKCNSSQNGRGGTFYVLNNAALFKSLSQLLAGQSAPVKPVTPDGTSSSVTGTAPASSPTGTKTASKKKAPVKKKSKTSAKKTAKAKRKLAPKNKKAKPASKAKKTAVKKKAKKKTRR
ncbi:MAG: deoxyribonuclease II [Bacteroidetes bacterium]|nr:MAG: deoxyribonuclease II [Bacteroidota bacterium]